MTKKTIQLNPVNSSQIESMGYHPETKTLAITFKRGGEYHYANVEQADYDALRLAKSVGSAWHGSAIKANPVKYPYTRQPAVQTAGETNVPANTPPPNV